MPLEGISWGDLDRQLSTDPKLSSKAVYFAL